MTAATTRKPVVATDVFNSTLTLNFITGQELSVTLDNLSPEILRQAALHGLKQKLVDAAAIARNPDNGATATPADKFAAVKAVYDRITRADGTWNANREGEVKQAGGMFLRALMELTKKDKESVQLYLEGLSKEQVAAMKKNQKVLDIMQRMEREAAAKVEDTADDLLDQLAGLGSVESVNAEADKPAKSNGKKAA